VTTYYKKNPSFSVIDMDEEFMVPLNYYTHYFDIKKAEVNPRNAKWEPLHDYIGTYNMQDVSPDGVYRDLALKVRENEEFAMIYKWNKAKQSAAKLVNQCDDYCRLRLYCEIAFPEIFEFNECLGNPEYDFLNDFTGGVLNLLTAEWVKPK
jgi:hypothetical protein